MDAMGIPTSPDPLPATIPLTAQLRLPLAEPPTHLQLHVLPVSQTDAIDSDVRGYRWWNHQETPVTELPLEREQAIDLDLRPGLYVLGVSAWWDQAGDVTYGFFLKVE